MYKYIYIYMNNPLLTDRHYDDDMDVTEDTEKVSCKDDDSTAVPPLPSQPTPPVRPSEKVEEEDTYDIILIMLVIIIS
jgi:hypothetical protein